MFQVLLFHALSYSDLKLAPKSYLVLKVCEVLNYLWMNEQVQ